MNYKNLKILGLNDNEAKIYLAILEMGEATISRISQRSKIKRTTVYLPIRNLKEQGLIGQAKKFGQMRYFARDPKKLTEIMEEKKEKLNKLMPSILAMNKVLDQKPIVRYFEGHQSAKQIYDTALEFRDQELLSWDASDEQIIQNNNFAKEFAAKRLKKKVKLKTIVPKTIADLETHKNNQQKICQTKYAPDNMYFGKTEIILYGKNKVGIIVFDEELGIIIESQSVHDTLKSIFNILWEKL